MEIKFYLTFTSLQALNYHRMSTDLTVMESNTLKKKSLSFFLIVKIDFVKTKEKAFQA